MGFLKSFFSGDEPTEDEARGEDGESSAKAQAPVFDTVRVFERAGIDAEQRRIVEKAQELIRALPEGTAPATNRRIVEASLNAFDVSIDRIVEAASDEIRALEQLVNASHEDTERALAEGRTRVAELEAEIASARESMDDAREEHRVLEAAARDQIRGIEPITAFFERPTDAHTEPERRVDDDDSPPRPAAERT